MRKLVTHKEPEWFSGVNRIATKNQKTLLFCLEAEPFDCCLDMWIKNVVHPLKAVNATLYCDPKNSYTPLALF
jgi:hypothetical protein